MNKVLSIGIILVLLIGGGGYLLFKGNQPSPSSSASNSTTASISEIYTLDDVSAHNSAADCWMVINRGVYDVTSYVNIHPGGNVITSGCGTDATQLFESERKHSGRKAQTELQSLQIGVLE